MTTRSRAQRLQDAVQELFEIDKSDKFSDAKQLIKRRNRLRRDTRSFLSGVKRMRFPEQTELFVTLVPFGRGRISYKGVAEQLQREYQITEDNYHRIVDENRGEPARRLVYGTTADSKYHKAVQEHLFVVTS